MAWQEIEGTKPPLKYDEEEEEKELPADMAKNEQEEFTKELRSGIAKPELPPRKQKKEVIFDSKKGYKRGFKKE